jgi:hypothetical protein
MTRRWITGGFRVSRAEFTTLNPVTGQPDILERIFHNVTVTAFNEGDARASAVFTMVPESLDFQADGDTGLGPNVYDTAAISVEPGTLGETAFRWRGGAPPLPGRRHVACIALDADHDVVPGGQIVMIRMLVGKASTSTWTAPRH